MKIDFDNPKWTAYVLGELSPEERAAVELELASSPEVQKFVNELKMAADTMKESLHQEVGALTGLSFAQRKTVREAATPATQPNGWRAWFAPFPLWTAGIATVAAVLVVGVMVLREKQEPPQPQIAQTIPTPQHLNPPMPPKVDTGQEKTSPPSAVGTQSNPSLNQAARADNPAIVQEKKLADEPRRYQPLANDRNDKDKDDKKETSARESLENLNREAERQERERTTPVVAPPTSAGVQPMPTPPAAPRLAEPTLSVASIPAPAQTVVAGGTAFGLSGNTANANNARDARGNNNSNGNQGGIADSILNNAVRQGTASGPAGGAQAGAGRGGGGGRGGGAAGGAMGGFGQAQQSSNGLANRSVSNAQPPTAPPVPTLSAITPSASARGAANVPVTLVGSNFITGGFSFADNVLPFGNSTSLAASGQLRLPNSGTVAAVDPAVNRAITAALAASAAVVPLDVYGLARNANRPTNEAYDDIADNPYYRVTPDRAKAPFAVDVDTAGYSNVRRFLTQNQLPPRAAVRIEELVNYFNYDYPFGRSDHPITANIEAATAPWNPDHRLVRIGIKAKDQQIGEKASNLVFLIDVSGSMEPADRLPILKQGLQMLVPRLTENDRVTIVTYAGESGVALPPTNGSRKDVIMAAINGLRAEGSTNGGAGIQTAYDLAAANFIKGGVNRVVLMSDGDFNVGITNDAELVRLIEDKAKTGVFLSILGVGTGNLKDSRMERLADRGNGIYAYIDSVNEAKRVLVDRMAGTLIAVAKDVKVEVEFNPAKVAAYRLIGYENRVMSTADFNDPKKDAGEMGAGHTVTALFEVVPVGAPVNSAATSGSLRYQIPAPAPVAAPVTVPAAVAQELLNVTIKYKDLEQAAEAESKKVEFPLVDRGQTFANASVDFRFAAAVAEFGLLLRDSPYRGGSSWESTISIANGNRGTDKDGYREEFVRLAQRAEQLWRATGR